MKKKICSILLFMLMATLAVGCSNKTIADGTDNDKKIENTEEITTSVDIKEVVDTIVNAS